MSEDLELLQCGQSLKQKRSTQRRLNIVKRIGAASALLALTAAALIMLVRQISPDTPNPAYRLSKNLLANKEYLEGVRCSSRGTKEGVAQGLAHFNRALEIDPNFTMVYAGLFEVYVSADQARAYASTLMRLDPMLAEAQAAQAWIDFLDWKWPKAEPEFQRAIQLNLKCAIAHMRYGFCLVYSGRPDEGHEELRTAEILDPTNPRIKKNIGHVFYVKRQFREAIAQYQKALDLEPSYPTAAFIGMAYRALDDYTNAIDELEKGEILIGNDRAQTEKTFNELRQAYQEGGRRGYWLKALAQAEAAGYLFRQSEAHAKLGHYDQALTLLEQYFQKIQKNEPESIENLFFPECWDDVHTDSRFIALLKKTGLKK